MTSGAAASSGSNTNHSILRALIAASTPVDDTFHAARATAEHLVGSVATHIHWYTAVTPTGDTYTAGAMYVLDLRFEHEEPGSERLLVRVPCPHDPGCLHAYDQVTSKYSLIAVLDGDTATEDDVHCFTHDDQ